MTTDHRKQVLAVRYSRIALGCAIAMAFWGIWLLTAFGPHAWLASGIGASIGGFLVTAMLSLKGSMLRMSSMIAIQTALLVFVMRFSPDVAAGSMAGYFLGASVFGLLFMSVKWRREGLPVEAV